MHMIKYRYYDQENKIDMLWVESSNIFFIKMVENQTENYGDLYVTFKNGSTYIYKNVDFKDYIPFIMGGATGSYGKSFNLWIKNKYPFEKSENISIQELTELMEKTIEENEKN